MADDGSQWRGRLIDERYLVESVLGQGGMGVVLRARHQFTGATVALKLLRQELATDPELQRRFLAEARAGNAIGHHGIVQVLDAGRDATGELYLAMELLVGEALRAPIKRGALAAPDIARIGIELAEALGAAHARGFVHRDLKPENVFLVAPGNTVKLLDFGIAKMLTAEGTLAGRTAAGVVMGTPAYMAPEQLKDARTVDARADLWALGVMLYEMLAGRLPFNGKTIEELFIAIATAEPTPLGAWIPNPPPALDAFFARALARDPAQRFATSRELAAALGALPLGFTPAASRAAMPVAESVLASGFGSAPGISGVAGTAQGYGATAPATGPTPRLPQTGPVPLTAPGQLSLPGGTAPGTARAEPDHRRRNALYIGIAALVAIGGVVVAYVATKPAPPPDAPAPVLPAVAPTTPVPDAALVASNPIPAPAPPPVDAALAALVPPSDAAVRTLPRDAATLAPPPPDAAVAGPPHPQPTTADVCAAGCALATRCGLAYAACEKSCAASAALTRCQRDASTALNCNAAAVCNFLAFSGYVPQGTLGCKQVALQQRSCGANVSCANLAMTHLAPRHAYALAMLDGCALSCLHAPSLVACTDRNCHAQEVACAAE